MWEVREVERELGMGLQFPAPSEVPRERWVNLQWVAAPGSSFLLITALAVARGWWEGGGCNRDRIMSLSTKLGHIFKKTGMSLFIRAGL